MQDIKLTKKEINKLIQDKPIMPLITSEEASNIYSGYKKNRDRYEIMPNRLPTCDLLPLPPDEHKHIGELESKQNLYLITAHAYNKLMELIESLEERIKKLEIVDKK